MGEAPEYNPEDNRQKRRSFGGGGKEKGRARSQNRARGSKPRPSGGKKQIIKRNRPKQ